MTKTEYTTYLVDHVGQETLHLIVVNGLMAPKADGGSELGDGDSGSSDLWRPFRLGFLESTSEKNFAQQVAQGDVSPALQREVDAALDELVFSFLESKIEGVKLASLNVSGEREEELLQSGIWLE